MNRRVVGAGLLLFVLFGAAGAVATTLAGKVVDGITAAPIAGGVAVDARGLTFGVLLKESATSVMPEAARAPQRVELVHAYLNPFNPSTTLQFRLPVEMRVRLTVFDALGRQVASLTDKVLPAGGHSVVWHPQGAPGGGSYARLEAGSFVGVTSVILVR